MTLLHKLSKLEEQGKVTIDKEKGTVEILGKDEKENKEIIQSFMYSDPKTCLQMMQQMTKGEKQYDDFDSFDPDWSKSYKEEELDPETQKYVDSLKDKI
tara:strand:+ start:189 stop:485 length:297 start_codon:yes stop_codon:yes gene_type:complete